MENAVMSSSSTEEHAVTQEESWNNRINDNNDQDDGPMPREEAFWENQSLSTKNAVKQPTPPPTVAQDSHQAPATRGDSLLQDGGGDTIVSENDPMPREKAFWDNQSPPTSLTRIPLPMPPLPTVAAQDNHPAPAPVSRGDSLLHDGDTVLTDDGPMPRDKEFWEEHHYQTPVGQGATALAPTTRLPGSSSNHINDEETITTTSSVVLPPPSLQRGGNVHEAKPGAFSVVGQQMDRRNTGFISPQDLPRSKELLLQDLDNRVAQEQQQGGMENYNTDVVLSTHNKKDGKGVWSLGPIHLSRRTVCIAAVVVVAIVIGVVVGVIVSGSSGGDSKDDSNEPQSQPSPPTMAPTASPTLSRAKDTLEAILEARGRLPTNETLSTNPDFYVNLANDTTQPPSVRAMSWILFEDLLNLGRDDFELIPRYALVTLFYATRGENWTSNTGWLTQLDVCDWEGISTCGVPTEANPVSPVLQLELDNHNLQHELPDELGLLSDLTLLSVSRNVLKGTIPAQALALIPNLARLELDNNQLTGTIDAVLARGNLTAFFVQENNLDPNSVFPFCNGTTLLLEEAGLDCDVLECDCCVESEHCF